MLTIARIAGSGSARCAQPDVAARRLGDAGRPGHRVLDVAGPHAEARRVDDRLARGTTAVRPRAGRPGALFATPLGTARSAGPCAAAGPIMAWARSRRGGGSAGRRGAARRAARCQQAGDRSARTPAQTAGLRQAGEVEVEVELCRPSAVMPMGRQRYRPGSAPSHNLASLLPTSRSMQTRAAKFPPSAAFRAASPGLTSASGSSRKPRRS